MRADLLIKRATLYAGENPTSKDILILNGRIASIAESIPEAAGIEVIDAHGLVANSGFTDIHVHFREPGFEYKETIKTGSEAAARGGYTTVCTMPNLNPVPDSPENIEKELSIIRRDAIIEVRPYASITRGREGKELVDMAALKDSAVAFSDDGSGVQNSGMMEAAMRLAQRENCIIAAHCEDESLLRGGYIHDGRYCKAHGHRGICSESEWGQIERDLALCEKTGCRYHVCHISTAESVKLIRDAKERGVRVSCETAPHYLALCEDDLREEGRFKMNPPLRSAADRDALIEGLADGTIDAIATDHAPHSAEEKSRGLEGSAMGISGLETAFPILYTSLVLSGKISFPRLLEALSSSPRRIFRLGGGLREGEAADLVLLDTSAEFIIDGAGFASKGKSTPFQGLQVQGRAVCTVKDGKIVWKL